MRYIVILLLVLNVAFAAWMVFASVAPSEQQSRPDVALDVSQSEALIVLLEERPKSQGASKGTLVADKTPIAEINDVASNSKEGLPKLCTIVGPFEQKSAASVLLERLKAIQIVATIETMAFSAGDGYWVYLPAQLDRKAALKQLAQLQSRGIDSYIIPKGDKKNSISLGVYSKKALADARFELAKELNLNPLLEIIDRKYNELWVMLEPEQAQKMSEITWSRMLEDKKNLQRRENYCLGVASE